MEEGNPHRKTSTRHPEGGHRTEHASGHHHHNGHHHDSERHSASKASGSRSSSLQEPASQIREQSKASSSIPLIPSVDQTRESSNPHHHHNAEPHPGHHHGRASDLEGRPPSVDGSRPSVALRSKRSAHRPLSNALPGLTSIGEEIPNGADRRSPSVSGRNPPVAKRNGPSVAQRKSAAEFFGLFGKSTEQREAGTEQIPMTNSPTAVSSAPQKISHVERFSGYLEGQYTMGNAAPGPKSGAEPESGHQTKRVSTESNSQDTALIRSTLEGTAQSSRMSDLQSKFGGTRKANNGNIGKREEPVSGVGQGLKVSSPKQKTKVSENSISSAQSPWNPVHEQEANLVDGHVDILLHHPAMQQTAETMRKNLDQSFVGTMDKSYGHPNLDQILQGKDPWEQQQVGGKQLHKRIMFDTLDNIDGQLQQIEEECLRLCDPNTAYEMKDGSYQGFTSAEAKLDFLMAQRDLKLEQKERLLSHMPAYKTGWNTGKIMNAPHYMEEELRTDPNLRLPLSPKHWDTIERTHVDHNIGIAGISHWHKNFSPNPSMDNDVEHDISYFGEPLPEDMDPDEKKARRMQHRVEVLQAVVDEKNELINRLIGDDEFSGDKFKEAVWGNQKQINQYVKDGVNIDLSHHSKHPLNKNLFPAAGHGEVGDFGITERTWEQQIAEQNIESMIQAEWRDRQNTALEAEFSQLKDKLKAVKNDHREEKLRSMLQELQDLRSDPSLQIYYDAPAEPLVECLSGPQRVEAFRRGYLQADYIGADTIKANIRSILSDGVFDGLGVKKDGEGNVLPATSAIEIETGIVPNNDGESTLKKKFLLHGKQDTEREGDASLLSPQLFYVDRSIKSLVDQNLEVEKKLEEERNYRKHHGGYIQQLDMPKPDPPTNLDALAGLIGKGKEGDSPPKAVAVGDSSPTGKEIGKSSPLVQRPLAPPPPSPPSPSAGKGGKLMPPSVSSETPQTKGQEKGSSLTSQSPAHRGSEASRPSEVSRPSTGPSKGKGEVGGTNDSGQRGKAAPPSGVKSLEKSSDGKVLETAGKGGKPTPSSVSSETPQTKGQEKGRSLTSQGPAHRGSEASRPSEVSRPSGGPSKGKGEAGGTNDFGQHGKAARVSSHSTRTQLSDVKSLENGSDGKASETTSSSATVPVPDSSPRKEMNPVDRFNAMADLFDGVNLSATPSALSRTASAIPAQNVGSPKPPGERASLRMGNSSGSRTSMRMTGRDGSASPGRASLRRGASAVGGRASLRVGVSPAASTMGRYSGASALKIGVSAPGRASLRAGGDGEGSPGRASGRFQKVKRVDSGSDSDGDLPALDRASSVRPPALPSGRFANNATRGRPSLRGTSVRVSQRVSQRVSGRFPKAKQRASMARSNHKGSVDADVPSGYTDFHSGHVNAVYYQQSYSGVANSENDSGNLDSIGSLSSSSNSVSGRKWETARMHRNSNRTRMQQRFDPMKVRSDGSARGADGTTANGGSRPTQKVAHLVGREKRLGEFQKSSSGLSSSLVVGKVKGEKLGASNKGNKGSPSSPFGPPEKLSLLNKRSSSFHRATEQLFYEERGDDKNENYDKHGGYSDDQGRYHEAEGGYCDDKGGYFDNQGGYYDAEGRYYCQNGFEQNECAANSTLPIHDGHDYSNEHSSTSKDFAKKDSAAKHRSSATYVSTRKSFSRIGQEYRGSHNWTPAIGGAFAFYGEDDLYDETPVNIAKGNLKMTVNHKVKSHSTTDGQSNDKKKKKKSKKEVDKRAGDRDSKKESRKKKTKKAYADSDSPFNSDECSSLTTSSDESPAQGRRRNEKERLKREKKKYLTVSAKNRAMQNIIKSGGKSGGMKEKLIKILDEVSDSEEDDEQDGDSEKNADSVDGKRTQKKSKKRKLTFVDRDRDHEPDSDSNLMSDSDAIDELLEDLMSSAAGAGNSKQSPASPHMYDQAITRTEFNKLGKPTGKLLSNSATGRTKRGYLDKDLMMRPPPDTTLHDAFETESRFIDSLLKARQGDTLESLYNDALCEARLDYDSRSVSKTDSQDVASEDIENELNTLINNQEKKKFKKDHGMMDDAADEDGEIGVVDALERLDAYDPNNSMQREMMRFKRRQDKDRLSAQEQKEKAERMEARKKKREQRAAERKEEALWQALHKDSEENARHCIEGFCGSVHHKNVEGVPPDALHPFFNLKRDTLMSSQEVLLAIQKIRKTVAELTVGEPFSGLLHDFFQSLQSTTAKKSFWEKNSANQFLFELAQRYLGKSGREFKKTALLMTENENSHLPDTITSYYTDLKKGRPRVIIPPGENIKTTLEELKGIVISTVPAIVRDKWKTFLRLEKRIDRSKDILKEFFDDLQEELQEDVDTLTERILESGLIDDLYSKVKEFYRDSQSSTNPAINDTNPLVSGVGIFFKNLVFTNLHCWIRHIIRITRKQKAEQDDFDLLDPYEDFRGQFLGFDKEKLEHHMDKLIQREHDCDENHDEHHLKKRKKRKDLHLESYQVYDENGISDKLQLLLVRIQARIHTLEESNPEKKSTTKNQQQHFWEHLLSVVTNFLSFVDEDLPFLESFYFDQDKGTSEDQEQNKEKMFNDEYEEFTLCKEISIQFLLQAIGVYADTCLSRYLDIWYLQDEAVIPDDLRASYLADLKSRGIIVEVDHQEEEGEEVEDHTATGIQDSTAIGVSGSGATSKVSVKATSKNSVRSKSSTKSTHSTKSEKFAEKLKRNLHFTNVKNPEVLGNLSPAHVAYLHSFGRRRARSAEQRRNEGESMRAKLRELSMDQTLTGRDRKIAENRIKDRQTKEYDRLVNEAEELPDNEFFEGITNSMIGPGMIVKNLKKQGLNSNLNTKRDITKATFEVKKELKAFGTALQKLEKQKRKDMTRGLHDHDHHGHADEGDSGDDARHRAVVANKVKQSAEQSAVQKVEDKKGKIKGVKGEIINLDKSRTNFREPGVPVGAWIGLTPRINSPIHKKEEIYFRGKPYDEDINDAKKSTSKSVYGKSDLDDLQKRLQKTALAKPGQIHGYHPAVGGADDEYFLKEFAEPIYYQVFASTMSNPEDPQADNITDNIRLDKLQQAKKRRREWEQKWKEAGGDLDDGLDPGGFVSSGSFLKSHEYHGYADFGNKWMSEEKNRQDYLEKRKDKYFHKDRELAELKYLLQQREEYVYGDAKNRAKLRKQGNNRESLDAAGLMAGKKLKYRNADEITPTLTEPSEEEDIVKSEVKSSVDPDSRQSVKDGTKADRQSSVKPGKIVQDGQGRESLKSGSYEEHLGYYDVFGVWHAPGKHGMHDVGYYDWLGNWHGEEKYVDQFGHLNYGYHDAQNKWQPENNHGHFDRDGIWHEGHYDENGTWREGHYDKDGTWHEGKYDENGEWQDGIFDEMGQFHVGQYIWESDEEVWHDFESWEDEQGVEHYGYYATDKDPSTGQWKWIEVERYRGPGPRSTNKGAGRCSTRILSDLPSQKVKSGVDSRGESMKSRKSNRKSKNSQSPEDGKSDRKSDWGRQTEAIRNGERADRKSRVTAQAEIKKNVTSGPQNGKTEGDKQGASVRTTVRTTTRTDGSTLTEDRPSDLSSQRTGQKAENYASTIRTSIPRDSYDSRTGVATTTRGSDDKAGNKGGKGANKAGKPRKDSSSSESDKGGKPDKGAGKVGKPGKDSSSRESDKGGKPGKGASKAGKPGKDSSSSESDKGGKPDKGAKPGTKGSSKFSSKYAEKRRARHAKHTAQKHSSDISVDGSPKSGTLGSEQTRPSERPSGRLSQTSSDHERLKSGPPPSEPSRKSGPQSGEVLDINPPWRKTRESQFAKRELDSVSRIGGPQSVKSLAFLPRYSLECVPDGVNPDNVGKISKKTMQSISKYTESFAVLPRDSSEYNAGSLTKPSGRVLPSSWYSMVVLPRVSSEYNKDDMEKFAYTIGMVPSEKQRGPPEKKGGLPDRVSSEGQKGGELLTASKSPSTLSIEAAAQSRQASSATSQFEGTTVRKIPSPSRIPGIKGDDVPKRRTSRIPSLEPHVKLEGDDVPKRRTSRIPALEPHVKSQISSQIQLQGKSPLGRPSQLVVPVPSKSAVQSRLSSPDHEFKAPEIMHVPGLQLKGQPEQGDRRSAAMAMQFKPPDRQSGVPGYEQGQCPMLYYSESENHRRNPYEGANQTSLFDAFEESNVGKPSNTTNPQVVSRTDFSTKRSLSLDEHERHEQSHDLGHQFQAKRSASKERREHRIAQSGNPSQTMNHPSNSMSLSTGLNGGFCGGLSGHDKMSLRPLHRGNGDAEALKLRMKEAEEEQLRSIEKVMQQREQRIARELEKQKAAMREEREETLRKNPGLGAEERLLQLEDATEMLVRTAMKGASSRSKETGEGRSSHKSDETPALDDSASARERAAERKSHDRAGARGSSKKNRRASRDRDSENKEKTKNSKKLEDQRNAKQSNAATRCDSKTRSGSKKRRNSVVEEERKGLRATTEREQTLEDTNRRYQALQEQMQCLEENGSTIEDNSLNFIQDDSHSVQIQSRKRISIPVEALRAGYAAEPSTILPAAQKAAADKAAQKAQKRVMNMMMNSKTIGAPYADANETLKKHRTKKVKNFMNSRNYVDGLQQELEKLRNEEKRQHAEAEAEKPIKTINGRYSIAQSRINRVCHLHLGHKVNGTGPGHYNGIVHGFGTDSQMMNPQLDGFSTDININNPNHPSVIGSKAPNNRPMNSKMSTRYNNDSKSVSQNAPNLMGFFQAETRIESRGLTDVAKPASPLQKKGNTVVVGKTMV